MAHNKVKDWNEFEKIKELKNLKNVVFLGNEIYNKFDDPAQGRLEVLKKLPHCTMIDNILVTASDKE